jgi:hypothetical protein
MSFAQVTPDNRTSLLKGCDQRACGACPVLVGGERIIRRVAEEVAFKAWPRQAGFCRLAVS